MAAGLMNNPPPWIYSSGLGNSTQCCFFYKGAIFIVLVNGFSDPSGLYAQVFIHRSVDNGTTWQDVTPATPVVVPSQIFNYQVNVVLGNVLYVLLFPYTSLTTFSFARFSLDNLVWLSNTASFTNLGFEFPITQAVYRTFNNQILCFHQNLSGPNYGVYLSIYDIGTDSWPTQLSLIANTASATNTTQPVSAITDSQSRVHLLYANWNAGAAITAYTIQQQTIETNNQASAVSTVQANYVAEGVGGGYVPPQMDVSQLVDYLDVASNTRMLGFLACLRTAYTPNAADSLVLFTAPEADIPTWTQTVVPIVEVGNERLCNAGGLMPGPGPGAGSIGAGPIPSLLPVQLPKQTILYLYWTLSGALATTSTTPNCTSVFQWLSYAAGVFSAIVTDFTDVHQNEPGPLYPVLLSNTVNGYSWGVFFPAGNGANNPASTTISLYWDLFSPPGVSTAVPVPGISGGGSPYRCTPQGCESLGTKTGWGPLEIHCAGGSAGRKSGAAEYYAVYRSRCGNVESFPLSADQDVIAQIARAVTGCENVGQNLNNPGALCDEIGRVYRFPDFQSGWRALQEMILAHIGKRRVL